MERSPPLWDDRRRSAGYRALPVRKGGATPSDRPDFSSMADDYARHALSKRALETAFGIYMFIVGGRFAISLL